MKTSGTWPLRVPVVGLLLAVLVGCAPEAGTGADADDPAAAEATRIPTAGAAASDRWLPQPGSSWQWQLSGTLDLTVDAEIFDVDYERTSAEEVEQLHRGGAHVICYLSAGSWEDYRPDAARFPDSVRGEVLDGWPDEQWLDIRRLDELLPIMAARMDTCAEKGFDAVEPDNMDGYANHSGFPLSYDDQLAYNRALAALAHERGLSVALKNDLDQIPVLVDDFDFALNEECARYDECARYAPFIQDGKAVLHVEYEGYPDFCARVPEGFSSLSKPLELDAERSAC
ncbi:hypothetical protein BN1051_01035 [Arthrobacter saudimassiliensis]|uniref:Glycoside-hydrolase family GH114 TIM-barrel domain-containing protein n=1 Tax=Arthrobacter saudimassiliensis TaxID=1461584 RepID=A0A078MN72_9MICC|nr:hypothetical protein BN1051_01035 [Arthrobacter saudimassiliensis]